MSTAKILSGSSNAAMVQLPTRRFPSMCIQGDTLMGLATTATKLAQSALAGTPPDDDFLLDIVHLNNVLAGLAMEYDRVLKRADAPRPYSDASISRVAVLEAFADDET